ncbi:hypothetical protein AN478_08705 [Thiohalorhabdus denitrificans]|uniref:General secretion pathway protein G n=1 Tax=Thiohalorhabdus denitrificans TaxID=381306 RepID=A0A0N8PN07_9GAMM|nr:hypothetical protein [Thiohalorhabdus denitrificans]KPV40197.1 hypothetical protein AN478_08705 [Thiohalorhabdus denitrificans]SCX84859.1 hypothetical protein SAMN05661077_0664 [Thiohalorhabdus denitrificans]
MERLDVRPHRARALEWALVLLFILIMSGVVLDRYEALEERGLATVAQHEHRLLELRVQLHRYRHGEWPGSLREVLGEDPRDIIGGALDPRRDTLVDDRGRVLDPFGRPYRYDPDSGELAPPRDLE